MGRFITFEGLDGSGKSTQLELLAGHLRSLGQTVVVTREPGGTALGEWIRERVVRDAPGAALAPATELALMCAARAQHIAEVLLPALRREEWVLCDRFHDATEAYQGGGRGLDPVAIRELHRILGEGLEPDRTVMLELDAAVSLERARSRAAAEQRFEREGAAFFARVAETYRDIARREPGRCRRVDASGSPAAVAARVVAAVADLLPAAGAARG